MLVFSHLLTAAFTPILLLRFHCGTWGIRSVSFLLIKIAKSHCFLRTPAEKGPTIILFGTRRYVEPVAIFNLGLRMAFDPLDVQRWLILVQRQHRLALLILQLIGGSGTSPLSLIWHEVIGHDLPYHLKLIWTRRLGATLKHLQLLFAWSLVVPIAIELDFNGIVRFLFC